VKMINVADDGTIVYDHTLDMSSVYGVFAFNIVPIDDPRLTQTIKQVENRLVCKTGVSGVARYEGDRYYRSVEDVPGNPWFITTLWLAQYYIERAKKESDFGEVHKWLAWVTKYAISSGVLSEQIHPHTGAQLSASPLTWSHSEYVATIIKYLNRLEELGICLKCNPLYTGE